MKKITLGVFGTREDAENAISAVHQDLGVSTDEISYLYRNTNDEVKEVDAGEVGGSTPAEGAVSGATTGGIIGAIAGIATVIGAIPVIGPVFAAGPLVAALGLGAGAIGTTAAAAATGAIAGGIIGALVNLGVPEDRAKEYEDRVQAGDILVVVHGGNEVDVMDKLNEHNAITVETYAPSI